MSFNSKNYNYRPTSMAQALEAAGLKGKVSLVREAKASVVTPLMTKDKSVCLKERAINLSRVMAG